MELYFIIGLFLLLTLMFLSSLFFLYRKIDALATRNNDSQSLIMLQNQLNEVNKTLNNKLGHSANMMQQQFGQSAQIIREVTEKLTKLDETNRQVLGFQDQLKNLERVLTSQKLRGNLGEAGLRLVLENILPPSAFKMQYKFEDGDIVDAAIFTKDGIIPVDAKFSLENYNRILSEADEERRKRLEGEFKKDLQKRIDETSKYIKPQFNTLDFAFMFIPAEAIYYDLLVNEIGAVKVNTRNLVDYAFKEKHVIIVSPTTFAAYLQTVLQGLNALKLEKQTKQIIQRVEMLGRHLSSYSMFFEKIGNNLATTVNSYNSAGKELKKIDKDVVKIAGNSPMDEPLVLERPVKDDNES